MDDTEKFLEEMENVSRGARIRLRNSLFGADELDRLLRLCRKYREALLHLKQIEDDKNHPWIATASLAYSGHEPANQKDEE